MRARIPTYPPAQLLGHRRGGGLTATGLVDTAKEVNPDDCVDADGDADVGVVDDVG